MDRMMLYEIIYALAAKDGREKALFGACAPTAREAFARSLVKDAFPELWFEIPLTGEPWFDLHALASYEDVAGKQVEFAGHGGVYAEALSWFASQEPNTVRQLALSYDSSDGDVELPAVQLLVSDRDVAIPSSFLNVIGPKGAKDSYRAFVQNMPQEWFACYVGLFPGRLSGAACSWVRVECIVDEGCQQAYAADVAVLRGHLAHVGLRTLDDDALYGIQKLARSPFPLELQFDVGSEGAVLPVVSASVRFQPEDWTEAARLDAIKHLVEWMQMRELADGRCGLLAQMAFAKRVEHEGKSAVVSCIPAFLKLRWREGRHLDAKAYLIAQLK